MFFFFFVLHSVVSLKILYAIFNMMPLLTMITRSRYQTDCAATVAQFLRSDVGTFDYTTSTYIIYYNVGIIHKDKNAKYLLYPLKQYYDGRPSASGKKFKYSIILYSHPNYLQLSVQLII